MRLIRFVAVACMVAVSVASLGCGGAEAPAKTEADTSSADTSMSTPADTGTETATTGTTPVSLAISGMA